MVLVTRLQENCLTNSYIAQVRLSVSAEAVSKAPAVIVMLEQQPKFKAEMKDGKTCVVFKNVSLGFVAKT